MHNDRKIDISLLITQNASLIFYVPDFISYEFLFFFMEPIMKMFAHLKEKIRKADEFGLTSLN